MRWFGWLVAGCSAPVGATLETTTDGGTWTVTLLEAPTGPGDQVLQAEIAPHDGELAWFVATMPDMGHSSDAGIEDLGGGVFALDVSLVMSGWWVFDGTVADPEHEETFRLEAEVP